MHQRGFYSLKGVNVKEFGQIGISKSDFERSQVANGTLLWYNRKCRKPCISTVCSLLPDDM